MDNKEKSPEQELIESIGLMIEKGMESNTNIYTGVVKSVDGKRAVVSVNGQNQNVSIATADVSSGNVVRVFVPEGNMSAAFIIKAEASGGGGTTTTAYGDLTGKPRINGVRLVDNKTSKELNLYGTDNTPPYPVTSVNGQTGDVTISAGGNVDSVNGKTGVVVLNKSDVGLGNVDNVRQYSTSNPPPYPVKSVDGATGAVVTNAVKTTPQSLSDTQKQQVRNNIGAGTSSFDGDYNSLTNKPTIPTKTSQLENDSHYITANEAPVQSVNSKTGAVQLNASDVGALPDTTVIPTKTSQLDNDSGFISDIPIASATQLGGVKVGAGLSVTENGVLSATGGGTADSVEWNNVLDKPTTIAGYGITDAKIENGTITLGNQTITPLTSAPVTSVNSKTGAVALTQDDVGDGATYVRTHNDFTDALKTQINTNKDNIAMLDGDVEGLQTDVGTLKTNVSSLQTALTSKQDVIVGAASTITDNNLATDRALISNSSGKVAVSNVTSTELGYLDGVTSNVQTQLNNKLENIPIATSTTLGGVKPVAKTSNMTQSVGVDANGALYTVPGGGGTGSGDMLKSVYDATGTVEQAGGIPDYVANNAPVVSVNGKTGAVTLVKADVGLSQVANVKQYSVKNPPPYPVTSVNGKTGDVTIGEVPSVTTSDNGKFLRVVNGAWAAVAIADANGVSF